MKRLVGILIVLSLLGAAALMQAHHDQKTDYFKARRVLVNIPKASTLKILSLGFHDAIAELLFLWSIQFYSTQYYSNRWDSIESVFDTIIGISPDNPDFYLTGSVILGREANKVHEAIKILERGANHFKNDYIYENWAGFYAATFLKDYKLAAAFQAKAAKRPNALPGIMNLSAHYLYMQDDLDTAWKLFTELKNTSPHASIRKSAEMHLYDIQFEWDSKAFQAIIDRYQKRYNRLPLSFEDLIRHQYLPSSPVDYHGAPYGYNASNGQLIPNQKSGWKKFS